MSDFSARETDWMQRALTLAEQGRYSARPNPMVGCVIVKNSEIVGEGAHISAGGAHAEVIALEAAGEAAKDADVFVTLEPCTHFGRTPPCVDALIAAGVRSVTYAAGDTNPLTAGKAKRVLEAQNIQVRSGLLSEASRMLNRGFFHRMAKNRPYVTLKLASTLDGKLTASDGSSKWITGPAARTRAQDLRAQASCIVTGIDTVIADDCQLTVREPKVLAQAGPAFRPPLRIVLDSTLRIPLDAKILGDQAETAVVTAGRNNVEKLIALNSLGIDVVALESTSDGRLRLDALLHWLADKEINEVLFECGPTLSQSVLSAGCVDEIQLFMAPSILGSRGRPWAGFPEIEKIAERKCYRFSDVERLGDDILLTIKTGV